MHDRENRHEGRRTPRPQGPGIDAQERRRVLLVVDTTPVLAKSTAGIGPAGEAKSYGH